MLFPLSVLEAKVKHLNKNEGHMKSISKPHTVGGGW